MPSKYLKKKKKKKNNNKKSWKLFKQINIIKKIQEKYGDRPEAANIAIVVTDGKSGTNRERTIPNAEAARAAGVRIIAVGVTAAINAVELRAISSEPHELGRDYFIAADFDQLGRLLGRVASEACVRITPMPVSTTFSPTVLSESPSHFSPRIQWVSPLLPVLNESLPLLYPAPIIYLSLSHVLVTFPSRQSAPSTSSSSSTGRAASAVTSTWRRVQTGGWWRTSWRRSSITWTSRHTPPRWR